MEIGSHDLLTVFGIGSRDSLTIFVGVMGIGSCDYL